MRYWYPTQKRVFDLDRELAALERLVRAAQISSDQHISQISSVLTVASRRLDFPNGQIPRWVWVASQFRLHLAAADEVAARSGASIYFLIQKLQHKVLSSADVQDLNWILDSTIRQLRLLLPAQNFRRCLADEEVRRIDESLHLYADEEEFKVEEIRESIKARLGIIRSFGSMSDVTDLDAKVEALFASAIRETGEYRSARAALRYLAEEDDVVSDGLGFLGLLDDIYVLEWAYAAVETQTRCLPVLEGLLRRWPFVGELAILQEGRVPLSRFGQYTSCIALRAIFETTQPTIAILREPGPYPLLAAFMAAVECARRQTTQFEAEISLWRKGDPLVISDGVETFKVTFEGTQQLRGTKYRIGVKDSGTILVDENCLPYVTKAAKAQKNLSSGSAISKWLKDRHVDPLVNLNGVGRRLSAQHEAVLFVGQKNKLNDLIDSIRPFGISVQSLLGVKYLASQDDLPEASSSFSDRPFIYACSDPGVAADVMREPPAHVSRWHLIVDGARLGRSICSSFPSMISVGGSRVCVFAELFDREATSDLINLGADRVWYLEDQDVEVPLIRLRNLEERDLLGRMLERRSAHWSSTRLVFPWKDDFLEAIAEYLRRVDQITPTAVSETQYRYDEFKAYIGPRPPAQERMDFDTKLVPIQEYDARLADFFERVVLVRKLRETRVLTGFSRLVPPEALRGPPARLSTQTLSWLPGFSVRGEGIFLQFRASALRRWSERKEISDRLKTLQRQHNRMTGERGRAPRSLSFELVLIHSFAHVLIRQLAFECGYDSSNIRERLYVSDDPETPMMGVLLYTASGDSEGTLGGLVRQGEPGRLDRTIISALANAAICSSDPLCIESAGQGTNSLNLAACHTCALLPETSCEEGNLLLDRVTMLGVPDNLAVGFFSSLLP